MGNQDAGQTFRGATDGGESLANLATAETGIDENARFRRFQIGAVAAGTAAEDCELNSNGATLVRPGQGSNIFP